MATKPALFDVNNPGSHNGQLVVGYSGGDPSAAPWHVGPMRGYAAEPTVLIEVGPGHLVHWVVSLCRLATHDEEVAYWRKRAEEAEEQLKAQG